MNVLVVEDTAAIREGVQEFLTDQGYQVLSAADGEEALALFRENQIHLMVLDIMLPKVDGIQVLREVRKVSDIPVLMLTAMTDEQTHVQSFDALADDYICKPFSLVILSKHIESLLRRHYGNHSTWTWGKAEVDFDGYRATYDGQDALVTPKELKLLQLLLSHAGRVLSREQMLDQVWGEDESPFDRVIDVYVKNLRKKLQLDCIVTVKGVGYKIEL